MTKVLRSHLSDYRSECSCNGRSYMENEGVGVQLRRSRVFPRSAPSAALLVAALVLLLGCETASELRVESRAVAAQPLSEMAATVLPGGQQTSAPGTAPTPPETVILRMHGSNTIGAELAPALAEAFLRNKGATGVKRVPRGADEVSVQGTFLGESIPKSIEIEAHGSATAFIDLKDNCDIGNSSRKIKAEEVASLRLLGDMESAASEHVLGLDGIAVIVNESNPIRSMSKDQIRQIFHGDVTDWKQVGRAQPGFINVYARDDKSGTWDTFKNLVLGTSSLTTTAKRVEDSRDLSNFVANDSNGIGFIGLPYVLNARAIAVNDAGTRPILPTALTVATESYPLSRRLYLYTASNPKNTVTREFVKFALSKEGQEIVTKIGFVGQTAEPVIPPPPPEGAPEDYKKLVAGAARLPLDFRFRSGKIDLDNKALEDMRRVVEFVSSSVYGGQKILLLGFADGVGPEPINMRLSQDRANMVAGELTSRGVTTFKVVGFGSKLPVATNATPEGREQNRRVEVWLAK